MKYLFLSLLLLVMFCGCGSKNTSDATANDTVVNAPAETFIAESDTASIETGMPTVVDFWAEWCGPCKRMKPIFESLEKKYKGKIAFRAVNVDEEKALAMKFGIDAIPTFVFLDKNGNEVNRIVGMATEEEMTAALDAIGQ